MLYISLQSIDNDKNNTEYIGNYVEGITSIAQTSITSIRHLQ